MPRGLRIFVVLTPCNMRGSFDALAGEVRRLGLEPLDGALYVLFSRRRNHVAVLYFDGSGWCLFRKRLERGTFEVPAGPEGQRRVVVDGRVLSSILDGIDLRAPRRRWYEQPAAPMN